MALTVKDHSPSTTWTQGPVVGTTDWSRFRRRPSHAIKVKNGMKSLAPFLAFVAALLATTALSSAEPQSAAEEADEYATSAHINLLKEGDADELRYWISGTIIYSGPYARGKPPPKHQIWLIGNGLLVRATGITQCKIALANPKDPNALADTFPCETVKNPSRSAKVLALLSELSNGKVQSCQVLDGSQWLFDGMYKGHRFSYRADNPEFCNDVVKQMNVFTDKWRDP